MSQSCPACGSGSLGGRFCRSCGAPLPSGEQRTPPSVVEATTRHLHQAAPVSDHPITAPQASSRYPAPMARKRSPHPLLFVFIIAFFIVMVSALVIVRKPGPRGIPHIVNAQDRAVPDPPPFPAPPGKGPAGIAPLAPPPPPPPPLTGDVKTQPKILYQVQAQYTSQARHHRIEGTVVIAGTVGLDGELKNIRVVKGLPDGLSDKAREAAEKMRFQPATNHADEGIEAETKIEFIFRLK